MSKKKHKKVNSAPNNNQIDKVEEVKVTPKEEKMITIEEMKALRNSVNNFEVPELDIPSASKIVIKGDEDKDEQADLLDKLLTEEDFGKKTKKKKIKAPEKEIDLMIEKEEVKKETEPEIAEEEEIEIPVITNKGKEPKAELPAKPKKEEVEAPKVEKPKKVKPAPVKEVEAKPKKKKRKKKLNYKNLLKLIIKIALAVLVI
ncbi:MAG: hypothetical protein MJ246_02460 [Clostridia bacterium]|nr:hypothetical protein [Clostridia bacterium]